MPPNGGNDDHSVLGGRTIDRKASARPQGPPDACGLFSAYYLGVTPDDRYQKPNIDEIARRHGMSPDEIRQLLVEFDIEPATVQSSGFDLEGALLDIKLAPEGISRTEIARECYETYLSDAGDH